MAPETPDSVGGDQTERVDLADGRLSVRAGTTPRGPHRRVGVLARRIRKTSATPSVYASAPASVLESALVDRSYDVVIVVDAQARVRYINPVGARCLALDPAQVIGTSALAYLHPGDAERIAEKHQILVRSPGATMMDTLRLRTGGAAYRVFETIATNCLGNEAIRGIIINGRDVTEREIHRQRFDSSMKAVTSAIASAVELRDPYTAHHQRQVAEFVLLMGRDLGMSENELKGIHVAAMLHDVGKVGIPTEILSRPGPLSHAEFAVIQSHVEAGCKVVACVPFPWPVVDMIRQHHERLDGSGYPAGSSGDAIGMGARIIAVADTISAMSEARPYRRALGSTAALDMLEDDGGRRYDIDVVNAALRVFRRPGHHGLREA